MRERPGPDHGFAIFATAAKQIRIRELRRSTARLGRGWAIGEGNWHRTGSARREYGRWTFSRPRLRDPTRSRGAWGQKSRYLPTPNRAKKPAKQAQPKWEEDLGRRLAVHEQRLDAQASLLVVRDVLVEEVRNVVDHLQTALVDCGHRLLSVDCVVTAVN